MVRRCYGGKSWPRRAKFFLLSQTFEDSLTNFFGGKKEADKKGQVPAHQIGEVRPRAKTLVPTANTVLPHS